MAGTGEGKPPPGTPDASDEVEGWTEADSVLEERIAADEARLAEDEARLGRDEQRLTADEQRLSRDERELAVASERIAEEERGIRRNWWLALALGGLLLLTIAALVISVIALNRDIDTVARAAPKDDSVGTAALKDGAVTGSKIADGAVGAKNIAAGAVTAGALAANAVTAKAVAAGSVQRDALVTGAVGRRAVAPGAVGAAGIAAGAVGTEKIANGAVTGAKVAPASITGDDVDEGSFGVVPRATKADQAGNAATLGGVAAASYLSRRTVVRAASGANTLQIKGPITATCPRGSVVIAGGAAIDGVARGVAITASAPDGDRAWLAEAATLGSTTAPWRLVVTAVCARTG